MKQPAVRIPALDGLRGIAVLSVLLYHYTTGFGEIFNTTVSTSIWEFPYGRYGVELFFIISGFVIYKTIERIDSTAEFLYKRIVRLYPTFWFCLGLTYIAMLYFGPEVYQRTAKEFYLNASMFPSFFCTRAIDDVYWSLLVQWYFYLFIVLLLFFRLQHKMKYIAVIYLICYAFICYDFKFITNWYYGSLFLLGIAFYRIWRSDRGWFWHVIIFSCLFLTLYSPNCVDFIVMAVLLIIFYLFVYGETEVLKFPPLVFLGEISYALYLTHQYIGHSLQLLFLEHGLTNYFLLLFCPMLIVILLAYLITILFERPIINALH